MKKTMISTVLLLLAAVILSACQPGANAAPAGTTNTPGLPIEQRDLATVVLQPKDLPPKFDSYTTASFDDAFPDIAIVHTGIVKDLVAIAKTENSREVFTNGMVVYQDEDQAHQAFQAIKEQAKGYDLQVGGLGDESYGIDTGVSSELIQNDIYLTMILWREGNTISYLSASNSDQPPELKQVLNLAGTIQTRITP